MGVLRNQLYSDKVLAVVREYTCNAVDANVEAGKADTPITVTLPNRMNPYFKVRDNGLGLTQEDVNDIYAFYGESTKRNSNDQIGMLGIGSKAAFAYGDNFVINSYVNGKKIMYNAYIDESQRGQISKLGEEDTSEPDGVEIVVPVRDDDYQEFQTKAEGLFKWFKVRPEVKGCPEFNYEDQKDILFSGTGWRWLQADNRWHSGNAHVIMGNIGYPIDQSGLNLTDEDYQNYNNLLTSSLVLEMDIGDVEISASREKLQFTEYTRKNILARLETVRDELVDKIQEEFEGCKTLFDAKCLLGELFDYGSGLYSLRDTLLKKMEFNGEPITDWQFSSDEEGITLSQAKTFGYQGKYRMEQQWCISCSKDVVVILNDLGHRRSLMGRVYPLVITDSKTVYMVEAKGYVKSNGSKVSDKKVLANWKKKSGFDGKMLTLSELPIHKLSEFGFASSYSASTADKDVKHSLQCFQPNWKAIEELRSWHRKKADFWEGAAADMDAGGVYLIIDQFSPCDLRGVHDVHCLANLKENLEEVGVKLPDFYAFKVKSRSKVENKPEWQRLDEWLEEKLKELIADNQQQAADARYVRALNENIGEQGWDAKAIRSHREYVLDRVLEKLNTTSEFAAFWEQHDTMQGSVKGTKNLNAVLDMAKSYGIHIDDKQPPTFDLKKLADRISKKYGMLTILSSSEWQNHWNATEEGLKERANQIANYIMVIDCCEAAKD